MQTTRPRIKPELNTADKIVEISGWLVLAITWIFVLTHYSGLPPTIAIHYNAAGIADGYGAKIHALILPAIASVILVSMTLLNKVPHIFNYLVTITEENAHRQYTNATRMVRYLKLVLVLIFDILAFQIIWHSEGKIDGLGTWFTPFVLTLIFVPLIWFIVLSFRDK